MKSLTKPFIPTSTVLLLVRLLLGVVFIFHGGQKVFGWFGGYGLTATVGFFSQNLGIPAWLGYVASFAEFLGGIGLIVGFLSRIWAIGLVINMLVAIFTVHLANGFSNGGNPNGPGYEYNLALIVLSLVIALLGPGTLSLDHLIFGGAKSEDHLGHLSAAH
jgi:putative oxidoreductase